MNSASKTNESASALQLKKKLRELDTGSPEYIDASNRLARLLFRTRPQEAISLCKRSIQTAKTIDYQPGLAQAYANLSHTQLCLSQYADARESANKAIQLFVHLDDPVGLLDANNALGLSYNTSGKYEKALELFLRNDELAREQGETEMQSKALNNIACILLDQGNYSSALEYFIRAYECTQNTQNSEMNGIALLNIGVTHLELDHLEEAREYLTRSLKSISGIPEIHSRVLQNLSHYYQKKGDLDQAIEYGTQALAGHQSIENIHGTIGTLSNMGEIYLLKNDLDKAQHYFEEALQLARAKDEKTEQAQNHLLLGRVYMRKKQPDVAIPILKKVFEFEQNYKTYIYEAHQELSRLYEEKKDYASALKHHKEYVRIKDALFTQQSEQKIQSLRITFKLEQAEREYRLLKQKNAELARSNKQLEQLTMRQQALNTQKSQLVEQLESYAHRDSLTNLFNRRYMDKQFQVEFDRAFSNDSPLCVMICDIDDFKQVNDQHSHTVGDQVLVEVSGIISSHVRDNDILSRYGGEEFVLLMPDTDKQDAILISSRIRELIEKHNWDHIRPGLHITISLGLCCDTSGASFEKMLASADEHLYKAKQQGKNQLCY